jgi:hypothetical protein
LHHGILADYSLGQDKPSTQFAALAPFPHTSSPYSRRQQETRISQLTEAISMMFRLQSWMRKEGGKCCGVDKTACWEWHMTALCECRRRQSIDPHIGNPAEPTNVIVSLSLFLSLSLSVSLSLCLSLSLSLSLFLYVEGADAFFVHGRTMTKSVRTRCMKMTTATQVP